MPEIGIPISIPISTYLALQQLVRRKEVKYQQPVGYGERLPTAPGTGQAGREPHLWMTACPTLYEDPRIAFFIGISFGPL